MLAAWSSRVAGQPQVTRFAGVVGLRRVQSGGKSISTHSGTTLRLLEWGMDDQQPAEVQVTGCPDRPLRVAFTGEIHNARELVHELTMHRHRLYAGTESELIGHAYEQWGDNCVERLWGMFAFAVRDERTGTLLLARDRSGSRSLYYCETDGGFAFGSHLTALRQVAEIPRDVDPKAIDCYLTFQAIPAPLTIYRSVNKLPAAHILKLEHGVAKVTRYWFIDFERKERMGVREAIEQFERLFGDVIDRVVDGRSCGLMLSGGLDSNIVLAGLSTVSPDPMRTFTFVFSRESTDEKRARDIASHFGAEPQVFHVEPHVADALPEIAGRYEQPYANPSALPMYYIAPLLRGHTAVVLTGEGADEVFSGRDRHLASAGVGRLQGVPAGRLAAAIGARLVGGRVKLFFQGIALSSAERHILWVSTFQPAAKARLYTPELLEQIDPHYALTLTHRLTSGAVDPLDHTLAVDFGLWIPEVLWVNLEPRLGAAGVEIRTPFLDHRIVEFSASLPPDLRAGWLTSKVLLRQAYIGRIPAQPRLIQRGRPKIPLAPLLRGELRPELEEILLSTAAMQRWYFRPVAVQRLVREHLTGIVDHSRQLWALLMLELWHRQWVD